MTNFRIIAAVGLVIMLATFSVAEASQAAISSKDKKAVSEAVGWMQANFTARSASAGELADAVVALAAAKKAGVTIAPSPDGISLIDSYANELELKAARYANASAGAAGKLALAAAAAKRNGCAFGGVNLSGKLNQVFYGEYVKGFFGQRTSYNQALAILGLKAIGAKVPAGAAKALLGAQSKFAWGYQLKPSLKADVESSSLIIEALLAERRAVKSRKSGRLRKAWRFISFQRNASGGFGPDAKGAATQANATAYVLRAADAMGMKTKRARAALRGLQQSDGGFNSTAAEAGSREMATIDSITALSGMHLPVARYRASSC